MNPLEELTGHSKYANQGEGTISKIASTGKNIRLYIYIFQFHPSSNFSNGPEFAFGH